MANFTNNRYPWPTTDHGGANAETGGNTRLLFAEQDNYRTRKGKQRVGTVSSATASSGVVTNDIIGEHSIDEFFGALTADPTGGSYGSGQSFYYHTTEQRFKKYDGTDWIDFTRTSHRFDKLAFIDSSYNIFIMFGDDDTAAFATAVEAAATGRIQSPISDNTRNLYYNTVNNRVENIHQFRAGTVSDKIYSGARDLFYVIPRVVSADIAETTENIPIEFLKGSLSANKAQAGAQTYGNGFSIAASEEGMHLFLRTLCNSRNDDIIVKTRNDNSTVTPKRDTLGHGISHVTNGDIAAVSDTPIDFTLDVVSPKVVQLSITPADIYTGNVCELQIDGYDHEGEELREIMILTDDDNDVDKLTDFYFAEPPEGQKTTYQVNRAGGTGATVHITSLDAWTEITFNQQDSVLLPGWTVEVRKGTIPFTYVGVSPNEVSIALSRDTALQMDITTIAFDSLPYTDIEGNRVNLDDGSGSEGVDIEKEKGRGEIGFIDASETLFTGWQAYLDVTEPGTANPVRVPLTDATFSINHQLDQAQLIVGDRRPGPPFRSTLRDVMLDGTILFTRERDWVRLFRNNTDFKNPVVVLRNASAGGFPYELHIELGLGQLMSSPDPQVSDLGLITQAFNMKFRETMSGMSDDFRFKIITDKWIFETEDDTVGGLRIDGIYAE